MSTVRPYTGPGAYPVRVYVGTHPLTGRPRRRSETIHPRSEKEYRREVARVRRKLEDERDAAEAEHGTIAELVDDWLTLARRDRSPSTMRKSYEPRANLIRDRFGTMLAAELKARDIDAWYTSLMGAAKKPKTAAGIHEIHRVFSAILQFGVDKDRLGKAATRQVTLPEHHRPDIRKPEGDVMLTVWAELPHVPWGDAVRLLAATGLRRGEVVGLRWDDWNGATIKVRHSIVELPGGGVAVRVPKGKRTRIVTLGRMGAEVLEAQRARGKAGPWVFGDGAGGPARPGWISTMWNRWRGAHGAAGVGLHGLRHWYATHAIAAGADPAALSRQLGHAQVSTTMNLYVADTDEGRQRVADAIDRKLGAG